MRLRYAAFVLGLSLFVQTGCKSCRHVECVPPPPAYPIQTSPPPVVPPVAPTVGTLPATDPDAPIPQPAPIPVRPTSLTAWSR